MIIQTTASVPGADAQHVRVQAERNTGTGHLPDGWHRVSLSELGDLVRGVSYSKDDVQDRLEPGFTPVLRATNIQDRGLVLDDELVFVRTERVAGPQRLGVGDVVIAMSSGSKAIVGKAAQLSVPWPGSFGAFCAVFRPVPERVDADYVGDVFQTISYRRHIEQSTRGTNINNLTRDHILGYSVHLPPLAEQRAIAHTLRVVKETIKTRQRELELERERKAAQMQHLFTKGAHGEPTKQTAIGEMPKSWQTARIGDLIAGTQYGLSVRGNLVGQYPMLRMNNLVDGHVAFIDLQYVDLDDETLEKFVLRPGDVLFNRTNSYDLVGKTAIFEADQPFVFASYLVRVAANPNRLLPTYLSLYLNWVPTQQRLRMLASRGVSQSNINASKLRDFIMVLPPLAEQEEIAHVLHAVDTKIDAEEREVTLLQELFRALLDDLMAGRLSSLPLAETVEHSDDDQRTEAQA